MAKMKLEEFGGASSDATKAIELDPKGAVKAYYRRCVSALQLTRSSSQRKGFQGSRVGAPMSNCYCRGMSQLAILQPRTAIADFKTVLELEPSNNEARKQLVIPPSHHLPPLQPFYVN
jgi:serine/threonine-protein phosphatase 5